MSRFIDIDSVEAGSILSEPITNNFGQILLPAGVTLEERHIRMLASWGIRFIQIKGDIEVEFSIDEESFNKALEEVKKRITWEPANAIENDILKAAAMKEASKNK